MREGHYGRGTGYRSREQGTGGRLQGTGDREGSRSSIKQFRELYLYVGSCGVDNRNAERRVSSGVQEEERCLRRDVCSVIRFQFWSIDSQAGVARQHDVGVSVIG